MHISVVVNLHTEGLMAVPSIRSVILALEQSRELGLSGEIIAVFDRASPLTIEAVEDIVRDKGRAISVDHGDLGLARNAGVEAASGRWVAFIDGDDLWGPSWLGAAGSLATRESREVVWHPQFAVYFENNEHIYEHVDMEAADFDPRFLLTSNYWTSAAFAPRSVLRNVPYQAALRSDRLGYEDWNWHCRTIEAGVLHKVVPDTVHFVRRRPLSMSRQLLESNAMCIPHTLFKGRGRLFTGNQL